MIIERFDTQTDRRFVLYIFAVEWKLCVQQYTCILLDIIFVLSPKAGLHTPFVGGKSDRTINCSRCVKLWEKFATEWKLVPSNH